eukprot:Plantae.Rhodophyta-Purpureofilum_apyrenoidigerum.ctg9031.p1 GENE.Plantae.Rhodophyta-Purpureofilum_apyrenoidigerum.ctg9031~~Plantae.Rhodophyta-Purpureofilum_apyrenoidigerum.ctg9031.p1  ORF type:complete len:199 (+),score=30.30 Plantae.Rhodophyta-Purpureofilum_apyrenoidigerum.ctg9031:113-709(+)
MHAFLAVGVPGGPCRRRLSLQRSTRSVNAEEAFGEVALPLVSVSSLLLVAASFAAREYFLNNREDAMRKALVEVRDAGKKGLGVFATREIPYGEYIGSYFGEVLTLAEICQRYTDWDGSYIFDLGNGKYIDATRPEQGNFTRYMNHCADRKATIRSEVLPRRMRVEFYAMKRISENEELCFDYGNSYWEGNEHLVIND